MTLRDFCKQADADPGNISKIERGIWPPPQDEDTLVRYASALGLLPRTDHWYRFFDYAAAGSGMIPADLLADEEVVKILPVFFRTIRGQKPEESELKALVDKIKRSSTV